MTIEDDVRTMLRRRADEAHVSDDAWERIAARLEERPPRQLGRAVAAVAAAAAAFVAGVLVWPEPARQVVVPPAASTTVPVDLPPHLWAGEPGQNPAEVGMSYLRDRLGPGSRAVTGRPTGPDTEVGRFVSGSALTELFFRQVRDRWLLVAVTSDLVPIHGPRLVDGVVEGTVVAEAAGRLTLNGRVHQVRPRDRIEVRTAADGDRGRLLAVLELEDGAVALSELWIDERDDPATPDGGLVAVWPATDAEGIEALQAQADSGERPDLLDPRAVAGAFLTEVLAGSADFGVQDLRQGDASSGEVPYALADGADGTVLVRRSGGEGSIWYVVGATSASLEIAELRREETHLVADVRSSMSGTLQWTGAPPVAVRSGEIVSIGRPDTPVGSYPVVVRLVDDGSTRAVVAELSRT